MINQCYYIETIAGPMKIICNGKGSIISSSFINASEFKPNQNSVSIAQDFNNYFSGLSDTIISKYKLIGTNFQLKVWNAIKAIKYGSTKTYKQIAEQIGHPKAYRAVANACNQNNLIIIIPCHRVTSKNNLGGFKYGFDMKKWLLQIENF